MKKSLLFFVFGILLISFISALGITTNQNSNVIVRDFDGTINLTMKISDAPEGIYNVYTLADVSIEPSEMFPVDGSITKQFVIKPNENLKLNGYYTFTYVLNHRDVEKIEQKMTIKLVNLEDIIEVYSDEVNYDTGTIIFSVKNNEDISINSLSGKFSSILFDVDKKIDLKPYEESKISVKVDKDVLKKTKAGVYIISSTFNTANGEKEVEGKLYLGEKKGVTTAEQKGGFLIQSKVITKTNIGNTLENVRIDVDKNIFSRLFTSFNTEPNLVERTGFAVHYSWIKDRLGPSEVYTVSTKTNYIFPVFIIIVVFLAIYGIKRFAQTKVEVTKSVLPVRTKNGEFALKIMLAVKSKKSVQNVTLIDRVPSIVKIYNKFGTIKPSRIDINSRRIHWNIGNLNAGEVRMVSYIVYAKVGVVGKFSLPEAFVVFEKDGQIHEVPSNQVFFMNEQIRKEE